MFVRVDVVRDGLALLLSEPLWVLTSWWCLTADTFLLRVLSERLPIISGVGDVDDGQDNATLCVSLNFVELRLRKGTNRPQSSRLLS